MKVARDKGVDQGIGRAGNIPSYQRDYVDLARLDSSANVLVICDGYSNLVISDRIEHFECLGHGHKIAGIVQIHESSSKLSGLARQLTLA